MSARADRALDDRARDVDAAALARELRARTSGEVRFDAGSRALYATDASNYRQVPIGVVIPRTIEDAVATVSACRRHGAPLLARGGGTSLCGQCCNVAVVMDLSKILEATVRLIESPQVRVLLVLGYPDVYTAGDHVSEIMAYRPIALEGFDDRLVTDMIAMDIQPRGLRLLPEGGGWLLVEFGGDTREEKHSTRGRARLLFEMLAGEVIKDGWRSEEVRDALHLCLSCKGCKSDCPVHVDMATYKAEFMAHYYRGRVRPRQAYVFGLIDVWSRLGAKMPVLANFLTRAPGSSALAKAAIGIPKQRQITKIATAPFTRRFIPAAGSGDRPRVILWPDTFNNFYHPDNLVAAAEILEAAGSSVRLPRQPLCCGRPLYEFGMLGLAKRRLLRILESLRSDIRAGVPVLVLEPACASVFRDELLDLFPADEDAKRLSRQTSLLCEFLVHQAPRFMPQPLAGKALVHGHCHHKSILTMSGEKHLLDKLGLDYEILDSGCCGMAGSFGFEKDKYDVSIACGERVLLPAVRQAAQDTLIIADGFSCREQIAQCAGRRALHIAEVVQMAMRRSPELQEHKRAH